MVATRQFRRLPLLPALLSALAASVCLIGLLLCAGAAAGLVVTTTLSGPGADLLPLLQDNQFPDRFVRRLLVRFPVFDGTFRGMVALGLTALALVFLRWMLESVVAARAAAFVADRVRRLRRHIHRQSLRLSAGDLSGEKIETTRRLFQDSVGLMESSARQWIFLTMTSGSDLAALAVTCCVVHVHVGLECLIPVVAGWFLLRLERKRMAAAADLLTEQVERDLVQLTQSLEKSRIVTGYGMETVEQKHFADRLERFDRKRQAVDRQLRRGIWVTRLIDVFAVGAPVWILLRHLLNSSDLQLPGATIIGLGAVLVFQKLRALEEADELEVAGTVAGEEVDEYIREVPPVSQVVRARFLEPMSRSLQFDQVCMDTPDHPGLLSQLDLRIPAGQRVSLISLDPEEALGLISLVPRLNDPTSGQILIDGRDISRATLESLRAEVMIVSGSNNLFNATVLENIICGQPDMTRQQAMDAGKIAHTEKFVRQLPKGYETVIGEFGVQLDAGQAFRLALTRAIARNPALLFIEEPTETLDAETKTLLDDTYDRICQNRTVVFLPSRLSTVKRSQRVILLNDGCVAADGTHEELVRKSELYRHWEYMKFNAFRTHR